MASLALAVAHVACLAVRRRDVAFVSLLAGFGVDAAFLLACEPSLMVGVVVVATNEVNHGFARSVARSPAS